MGRKNVKSSFIFKTFIQYIQDYRFNSILVKSLVIILLVLICSFAVIMALVTNQMNKSIGKEVGTMSVNALSKTQERMDTVMREVVQIAGNLSLNDDVMMVLLPDSSQLIERNSVRAVMDQLILHESVIDYLDSIYIYSSKNNNVITNAGIESLDDFKDITWHANLTERIYEPGRMITRVENNTEQNIISYIQPLRLTQLEFLGGIIINIDIDKLDELVISNIEDSNENLMIIDERNNIIFSSNKSYLLRKVNSLAYYDAYLEENNDGYQVIKDGKEDIVLTIASSKYFNWKYISTVPLSIYDEYQDEFSDFTMGLIILIVFISISGAAFISFYCYAPVMNILNLLKNPLIYKKRFEHDQSFKKDEAQEIGLNIIRNIYSNQQMQVEMKAYLKTIDHAQITALQAQLSPHFLFNTLDNIRWRIIDEFKGENKISNSILRLSEMLRTSLDNELQIIPIRDEIENTKNYIEILQLRYEGKLQVNWDVDETALDLKTVKISLQPIIENAVYHGIKPLRDLGIIHIVVVRLAEFVQIKVIDNGVGMSDGELLILNQNLAEKYMLKEDHIGILNVNQRLKLLIGDRAHMEIHSELGVGTSVLMEIPISIEEQS